MAQISGKKKTKEPRRKKVVLLEFDKVDWKADENRYKCIPSNKTQVDDRTLDKWASTKTTTPYCNPSNFMEYDEDEEEFRRPFGMTESEEDPLWNVTR